MALDRRAFLAGAAALVAAPAMPTCAFADGGVASMLRAALADPANCGTRGDKIRGTLARLAATRPPSSGKTIVVDLPSQTLTAYDGRSPALESVVVVGDPGWRTPDLDTSVRFVRFNPTWTVPRSIVEARGWASKLRTNPAYFERLNFMVSVGGRLLAPEEAAGRALGAAQFVQQAGPGNALGRVKLGLNAGEAVYLHDTNDQGAFDEDARALSHGCVRVEQAMRLAAWALGIDEAEARRLLEGGDASDRVPGEQVRVATTYFTAWPDASGRVQFYDDVYGRDRASAPACAAAAGGGTRGNLPVETAGEEY